MSGHTPSPWTIEPSWSERCGGDVSIVNRDHAGDDWDICTVHSTEANARLIAAAPELLEALIGLLEVEEGDLIGADFRHAINKAKRNSRAAIAAATGETK